MRWKLRLVEPWSTGEGPYIVGNCWFGGPESAKSPRLANYYKSHNSHREPLWVVLPGTGPVCVDYTASNDPSMKGWTVTGDVSNLTVAPSIRCGDTYHGYIQNGHVTADCDGRKYVDNEYYDYTTNLVT